MKSPALLLLSIASFLLALGWFYQPPVSRALQATPTLRPTATNVGTSSNRERDDTPAPTDIGTVQGFVYNYSAGGAPEPGLTVVLDGGGWQAEAVTDSNGFYQFAGLGASQATLNIRLPPDAHSLMPNWPIFTASSAGENINLGFYWGDVPPLPVLMSITPIELRVPLNQGLSLQINLQNQSGGDASNALVDVRLPSGVLAQQATSSHGTVDFSERRIWGNLGTLGNGETGTLAIDARFAQNADSSGESARVTFTYDEQLTPQVLEPTFVPLAASETGASTSTTPSSATRNEASPAAESLIPTTGESNPTSANRWPVLVLSLMLIVWAGIHGAKTTFAGRVRQ